jgi:two-component system, OmpR family, sensor histidine kinase CiaH
LKMFKEARIKLTVWYLAIIMAISVSFSGVIYFGINSELNRIENFQKVRIQGIVRGFPEPPSISQSPDSEAIAEARARILLTLGFINLGILIISGLGGYFLAGQTLDPIKEMVDKQKDFVSNASHELRTPLTSLKTEIEVALRDKKMTTKDFKKLLSSNLEDVDRMQKLSNYLLKLNRYERTDDIKFEKVDLKSVVQKAAGTLKFKSKFDLSLEKSLVYGNEDSLIDLTVILMDNAVKYGDGKKIEVITKKEGTLEVKDYGVGISKEELPHIFDRFYRADASRNKEKIDGYGLGLAIAKSIVELHNGTIQVTSKQGKGTTFKVSFKLPLSFHK